MKGWEELKWFIIYSVLIFGVAFVAEGLNGIAQWVSRGRKDNDHNTTEEVI